MAALSSKFSNGFGIGMFGIGMFGIRAPTVLNLIFDKINSILSGFQKFSDFGQSDFRF